MIKNLLNNFWVQCAISAYEGACVGIVTFYLGLTLMQQVIKLF